MKTKKRSKRYNKMDAALASARLGLKDLAVFHSEHENSDKYTAHMVNYKTTSKQKVSQSMAFALNNIRHKWNVHLLAIGVESNGKSRFEIDYVKIKEPLLQSDLVDYLNDRHDEFAEQFKKRNTLTNLAWLAVPNGNDVEPEQIDSILTKFGAW